MCCHESMRIQYFEGKNYAELKNHWMLNTYCLSDAEISRLKNVRKFV